MKTVSMIFGLGVVSVLTGCMASETLQSNKQGSSNWENGRRLEQHHTMVVYHATPNAIVVVKKKHPKYEY